MKRTKSRKPALPTVFYKTRRAEGRALKVLNDYAAAMARLVPAFGAKRYDNGIFRERPWPKSVTVARADLKHIADPLKVGDDFVMFAGGSAVYRYLGSKNGKASCRLVEVL